MNFFETDDPGQGGLRFAHVISVLAGSVFLARLRSGVLAATNMGLRGRSFTQALVIYGEETFQYLLAVERRRMERSGQPFLVLLVRFRAQPNGDGAISPRVAAKIFAGISVCLREVDFVGWYQDARVAGAVLAQASDAREADVLSRVAERVRSALHQQLPRRIADRLRLHVLTIRRRVNS